MPLTAQIGELIDKLDTVEQVRDQIAAILLVETKKQRDLAIAAGKDPSLWSLRVFTERSDPWEQFLQATAGQNNEKPKVDLTPIVCVSFDHDSVDLGKSNPVERQKYDVTYFIDCFGGGVSRATDNGHEHADEVSVRNAQRAMRLARNILMAGHYTYLGLRGIVWTRMISSREMKLVPITENTVQRVSVGRMTLDTAFSEFSPQVQGETIEDVFLTVKRAETGEVFLEADFPSPAPV